MGIKALVIVCLIWVGLLSPITSYSKTGDQIKTGIKNTLLPDRYGTIKESKIKDPDILLKELENYESYRPDSYNDATRNPFGDKKYKSLKIIPED